MKKKLGLTTKIFIGLILGAICGIILYSFVPAGTIRDDLLINGVFKILGKGFLRAMQMLVVPLVFCSLVCGSMAIGDTKKLGRVGVKTVIFYLITTAIAITIAIGIGKLINPGVGLDMSSVQIAETTVSESKSFSDVILDIIPTNPISSLANGNMLQIIFFSILVGIILAVLNEKAKTVANFFTEFNDIMMKMTMIVMKVAPIGVFCLIATTFSSIGWDAFRPMLKYIFAVMLALVIQCLITYMAMLKGFTKLSPLTFLKKFFPVMSFAFSTSSSNATIPVNIETLDNEIGVSEKISSFTIPLGATINMDGTAIMQGVAVVFIAQAFGIELGLNAYLTVILTATLASIGTAGVPGVGLITLSMVLESVGLPVEGIGIIMGIDRILDMTRTAVNVTGDAICTTIVAKQEGEFNENIFYSKETKLDNGVSS
ncbi:dicarboxylate/amino acid:cation symporter [Clostridioides difficile]